MDWATAFPLMSSWLTILLTTSNSHVTFVQQHISTPKNIRNPSVPLNITSLQCSLGNGFLSASGIDAATMVSQPLSLPYALFTQSVSVPLERLWTNNAVWITWYSTCGKYACKHSYSLSHHKSCKPVTSICPPDWPSTHGQAFSLSIQ